MARHRKTPTCYKCGAPNKKAIYKLRQAGEVFVGDDFLRWEPIKCKCEGEKTNHFLTSYPS